MSTELSGLRCARISMRLSDRRSSRMRFIRCACAAMMPRKRVRAAASSAGRTLQRFDESLDRRERRAQLMARIGDEVGPQLRQTLLFARVPELQEQNGSRQRRRRHDEAPALQHPLRELGRVAAAVREHAIDRQHEVRIARGQRDGCALHNRRKKVGGVPVEGDDAPLRVERDGRQIERLDDIAQDIGRPRRLRLLCPIRGRGPRRPAAIRRIPPP